MANADATSPADLFAADPAEDAGRAALSVLLPLPLAGPFDYYADRALGLAPGDFVAAPLGGRDVAGVVWGPGSGEVDPAKLRDLAGRLDAPPLPDSLRAFIDWVAGYTLAAPGAVLRMAMSARAIFEPPKPVRAFVAGAPPEGLRMTPARRRVLALAAESPPRGAGELAREAGVGAGVVHGLAEAGALVEIALPPPLPFGTPDPDTPGPVLSAEQRAAADALGDAVARHRFGVTLLDGVTGSGKTEVYFEAVAAALRAGRQVLVLLPEIALTPQWLDRFEARFGAAPAVWHSEVAGNKRAATWRAVAAGTARLVVGARSALFLPFAELGLVIVDEEHEAAFKQEDGVAYHARDMAVVRARLAGCPAVLVSATPSLETRINAARGRYAEISLPERYGVAELPQITAVDMRDEAPPAGRFLSPPLRAALTATVAAGEQAMLFLNRRGYAPLTLCRRCGHRFECPNCSAWLVEHRFHRQLQCHHCGFATPLPERCPSCDAENALVACGPGVERIAEEVTALLPDARLGMMTSDTIRGPEAAQALVRAVAAHEIDVLIGTQMVAKGHHFPSLTLVGIVDADLGLSGGDLRAAERTYQVLHQVAGRAGRADKPGRVLLQTWQPGHPVMRALIEGDRDAFMKHEADERRRGGWPPFGRLAAVVVSGPDAAETDAIAQALARTAPSGPDVRVLGPAPAPLALLRGRHRRRLLLKTARDRAVQPLLRDWLGAVKAPGRVRIRVDVDPYSFL
jgi:primosomal protein N' (replication factor Y)